MLENDESPEMRRLVVKAAGRLEDPAAIEMIETSDERFGRTQQQLTRGNR